MTLELYTDPRLPCPQRVHLTVRELGLDVTVRHISLKKRQNKEKEYTDLNPFATLPCLRDSCLDPPLVVYESRAIARYLAARYGPHLLPSPQDTSAIAKFEQAASTEVATFDPVANQLVFETVFKRFFKQDDPLPDSQLVDELQSRLGAILDVLDNILEGQKYMAGEKLTIVDLFYMPYMHHLQSTVWPGLLDTRSNMARWWNGLKERGCYRDLA